MTERRSPSAPGIGAGGVPSAAVPQTIHVHNHPPRGGWWLRIVLLLLLVSLVLNATQLASYREYSSGSQPPYERFLDGDLKSPDKIAVLEVQGIIMPPYSDRVLKTIERVQEDDSVRGVVLAVDSPGGLVADSHRIYRKLVELRESKPIVVSMGRLAASGGYYVAMGAGPEGKVFAEETTWTGSIGVIIPRYDLSDLGAKLGLQSDPLKTGPLKDALDPFRPLSDEERKVWGTILDESLDEFVRVIGEGRESLSEEEIRRIATGQIFTSKQALQLKLIDTIGDRDAAIESLKERLQLSEARVIRYEQPVSLVESLLGAEFWAAAKREDPLSRLLEASVPRAMYLFGGQGHLTP